MPGFPECFAAYGADHRDTMARFLGSESLYLRFLDMLPQDDNLRKLGAALADGDLERAFLAAHTLKGVAGNLGLLPLSRAVCAIVEPLRPGKPGTTGHSTRPSWRSSGARTLFGNACGGTTRENESHGAGIFSSFAAYYWGNHHLCERRGTDGASEKPAVRPGRGLGSDGHDPAWSGGQHGPFPK